MSFVMNTGWSYVDNYFTIIFWTMIIFFGIYVISLVLEALNYMLYKRVRK